MMREFTEDELRLRELYPSYYCSHCGAQAVCGIKHECVGTLRADLDREKGRRIAREVERDNAERDRDLAEDTIATLRAEVAELRDNLNEARVQVDERTDESEAWRLKYHAANDRCGALESTLNAVWIELVDDPAEDTLDHDGMPKRAESIKKQLAERTADLAALREEKLIDDPSREETA